MLNIVGALPIFQTDDAIPVDIPYRTSLIDWAAGLDIKDEDGDGFDNDARRIMGDPLHAEPALVQYGVIAPDTDGDGINDTPDLVAYVATNDGYLHAIDSINGEELWAFVPREMLPKLNNIFQNTGANGKQYGLDGNVVPWINDIDGNGFIDGSDTAYIYFGMRRGGRDIYSMEVTEKAYPKLRWKIEGGVGDYAELGQTWSTVNVEKILIDGNETTVLIFGGGYDTGQDTALMRAPDAVGRGIFIVDADTGELLWRAGINTDTNADLQLADMKYSIPARIKPLDVDGDGYIDRLYTGDMGGQIWRFEIDNASNTTAGGLSIAGGVLADLAEDSDDTKTRRFYYPPDVALIVQEGQPPFLSIVAGSGYRAHPLDAVIEDRMYMIRDFDVYTPRDFSAGPVVEADLFDTTANEVGSADSAVSDPALTSLSTAAGWYISLEQSDGTFIGEKVLSEPLILGGVAILTTYIPAAAGINVSACKANDGTGSLYFVNVTDGTPAYDLSGDITSPDSRSIYLDRGGIPPSPSVIITEEGTPTLCVGTECDRAGPVSAAEKMYWYEK
jgi:type IV pilus assembly protein PilY1